MLHYKIEEIERLRKQFTEEVHEKNNIESL